MDAQICCLDSRIMRIHRLFQKIFFFFCFHSNKVYEKGPILRNLPCVCIDLLKNYHELTLHFWILLFKSPARELNPLNPVCETSVIHTGHGCWRKPPNFKSLLSLCDSWMSKVTARYYYTHTTRAHVTSAPTQSTEIQTSPSLRKLHQVSRKLALVLPSFF